MSVSFPFQPQHTWRKLGYLLFTDSLNYREVINQNPQWNVTQLPPIGAQLRVTNTAVSGNGLVQGNFIFGTSLSGNDFDIFPFITEEDYIAALVKYSPSSVINREEVNGYALDSVIPG